MAAYVQIEGLKEFNRTLGRVKDRDLNKRLGQANKQVGELVVRRLQPRPDPRAVGAGRGAAVRPSATRREVVLRVGGTHRPPDRAPRPRPGRPTAPTVQQVTRMNPWGARRVVPPGTRTPDRPHIAGTVADNFDDIGALYLRLTMDALEPAFAERRA